MKKAAATVTQEKSQNPRTQSNPTLADFCTDQAGVTPKKPKSKLSKKTPKKPAPQLICPPNPFRESSPYQYQDDSPPRNSKSPSPERCKSPVRKGTAGKSQSSLPYKYDCQYDQAKPHSSSSQSSGEVGNYDDSDTDVEKIPSSDSESDSDDLDSFDDTHMDFHIPPVKQSRMKKLLDLPASHLIKPRRDADGDIDFGSVDFRRRICDYDAEPRYVNILNANKITPNLKFRKKNNLLS